MKEQLAKSVEDRQFNNDKRLFWTIVPRQSSSPTADSATRPRACRDLWAGGWSNPGCKRTITSTTFPGSAHIAWQRT
jgi:hypothetical protein